MSLSIWLLLCASMFVLALTPGPGMLAVIARSMSAGFSHGAVTTIGIVLADFIFIVLVYFGMSAAASFLGDLFQWVAYVGGTYLIYLGWSLIRSDAFNESVEVIQEPSWWSNFFAGLLITLSNPKAILFYAGFLPAFLDINSTGLNDLFLVMLAALIAVGSSMLLYAYLAAHVGAKWIGSKQGKRVQQGAGVMLLGTGVYMIVR